MKPPAGNGWPAAAASQARVSARLVALYSTLMCSTPGASTARRAVPWAKLPTVWPSAAAPCPTPAEADSPTTRSASVAIMAGSSAPEMTSKLRGLLAAVPTWMLGANSDRPTVANTSGWAWAWRTTMSDAIECPSTA